MHERGFWSSCQFRYIYNSTDNDHEQFYSNTLQYVLQNEVGLMIWYFEKRETYE